MDFSFEPKLLSKVKTVIIKEHESVNEVEDYYSDDILYKLIMKIANLESNKVKMTAYALSTKDINAIAGYIPSNIYKVSLDKLFAVLSLRMNETSCKIMFSNWQDEYGRRDCNNRIAELILQDNSPFYQLLEDYKIGAQWFANVLVGTENIAIEFGKSLEWRQDTPGKSIETLLSLGIREESQLYKDCLRFFLTFCRRADYLAIEEKEIIHVVKTYDDDLKKEFLKNFVAKLSLGDLEKHTGIAKWFVNIIGEHDSDSFKAFFANTPEPIVTKYRNWINSYRVEEYFRNDERSIFWKQYLFVSVMRYTFSDSVVMEFDNYIAVEFLGQDMGPVYIFEKDYYNQKVKYLVSTRSHDNKWLRQALYHNTEYDEGYNGQHFYGTPGYRQIHNKSWQWKIDYCIELNKITSYREDYDSNFDED